MISRWKFLWMKSDCSKIRTSQTMLIFTARFAAQISGGLSGCGVYGDWSSAKFTRKWYAVDV